MSAGDEQVAIESGTHCFINLSLLFVKGKFVQVNCLFGKINQPFAVKHRIFQSSQHAGVENSLKTGHSQGRC